MAAGLVRPDESAQAKKDLEVFYLATETRVNAGILLRE